MTIVDDLVKKSILAYPSVHKSRADVLHHVLCVIGNGYAWHKGNVVRVYEEDDRVWTAQWETARYNEQFSELGWSEWPDELMKAMEQGILDRVTELQKIVDTVNERIHDWTYEDDGIYPQTEYALLMNVPENVNPEWNEDLEKMREFARARGWEI